MGKYSNDYLNNILECFIPGRTFHISPIANGFINDTYLVLKGSSPKFILQRINHEVFKDVDGLMNNLALALQQLDSKDYIKINLLQSFGGSPFHKDNNGYWRLMTYIANSVTYNTANDEKIALEAGRIIGRFHQLLNGIDVNEYVDSIPNFHNLQSRKKQFEHAKSIASIDKLKAAQKAIDFAENKFPLFEPLTNKVLPIRICHNDTKLNNILFSKTGQTALCLIDLDTIMKGYFYYDFGDAIRTIANTAPENEKDLDKITFERHLFRAFVDGIALNPSVLSREEISTLPLGTIFMAFIHGLRALTDYLNNNVYYKVTYEDQNLDRCISLFEFSSKALLQLDFMEEYVTRKFA